MDRPYRARLDEFDDLPIQSIENRSARAVVAHEYLYMDGAELEDMGAGPRRCRFTVVYTRGRYGEGREFRAYVSENRRVSFVHPEYGLMIGRIVAVIERHDERRRVVAIDCEFVEQLVEAAVERAAIDLVPAMEAIFADSMSEQKASFANKVRPALGADANDVLNADLDFDSPVLGQLGKIGSRARSAVKKIDAALAQFESQIANMETPAQSVLALATWGQTLPDRVVRRCAEMVELHVQAVKSLKKAPYRFAFDLGKSIAALKQNVAEFADELTFAGAMRGATEIAKIYDADEVARETVRAIEQQSMFDGDGRIIEREAAPAIATIVEIERSLAHTRERLHECVVIDRSMRSPQAAAHALLEHVKRIKLELERVVEIYEPHPMPLHVICVKHDLSYAVAERILSLNPQIQNPTFCQGTIKIYER